MRKITVRKSPDGRWRVYVPFSGVLSALHYVAATHAEAMAVADRAGIYVRIFES